MSDVFTKRRPMIDLEEFERRLCRPRSTDHKEGDPLAALLRVMGGKDGLQRTDSEPETQRSPTSLPDAGESGEWKQPCAQVRQAGDDFAAIEAGLLGTKQPQAAMLREAERATVEYKRPNAPAPLLSGDFAAIEAGLLSALREQASATVSDTDVANAFPSVNLKSERRPIQDNQQASHRAGVRSRRPRFVMAAIVIIGMAGVAVSFGVSSRLSGPAEIASIKVDNGPDTRQTEATSGADVSTQDAAILSRPLEPSPLALDNGAQQPLDSMPAEERSPTVVAPIESQTPIESENTALPRAPALAQAPGEAPTAKPAGSTAKPPKPAMARRPDSHGQPRQIANKAKTTPTTPTTTEPGSSADPKAKTPTTQSGPADNGAFGFVQSAVNSLTSTTAKLFDWGRTENGSRP